MTWAAAAARGTPVTGYRVRSSPASETLVVGAATRSARIDELVDGTPYTFTVTALSARGEGPGNTSPSVTPTGSTGAPGAPADVLADPTRDDGITVSWSRPPSSSVTSYTITTYTTDSSTSNAALAPRAMTLGMTQLPRAALFDAAAARLMAGTRTVASSTVSGATTSYQVTGLTSGTNYFMTVRASNNSQTGSEASSNAATSGAPSMPRRLTADPTGGSAGAAIATFWQPSKATDSPADAVPADDYTVYDAGADPQMNHARTVTGNDTTTLIQDGLNNGVAYTFGITARNGRGQTPGPISDGQSVAGAPAHVQHLRGVGAGGKATLTWQAAAQNADTIPSYDIYLSYSDYRAGETPFASTSQTTVTVNAALDDQFYVVARGSRYGANSHSPSSALSNVVRRNALHGVGGGFKRWVRHAASDSIRSSSSAGVFQLCRWRGRPLSCTATASRVAWV